MRPPFRTGLSFLFQFSGRRRTAAFTPRRLLHATKVRSRLGQLLVGCLFGSRQGSMLEIAPKDVGERRLRLESVNEQSVRGT